MQNSDWQTLAGQLSARVDPSSAAAGAGCVVVFEAESTAQPGPARHWPEAQVLLDRSASHQGLRVSAVAQPPRCWALVTAGPKNPRGEARRQLGLDRRAAGLISSFASEWRAVAGPSRVWAGIGQPSPLTQYLPQACREALASLLLCRLKQQEGGACLAAHLGAYRFLIALPTDELHRLTYAILSPLVSGDGKPDTSVIATLEAYFYTGGNVSRAAERLYVHRNTVIYRLQRAEELLRISLHDPEQRTGLHLALLGYELLTQLEGDSAAASVQSTVT